METDVDVQELEKLVAVFDAYLSEVGPKTVTFHINGVLISKPISVLEDGRIFPVEKSEIKIGLYESKGKIILKTMGYQDEFLNNFGKPETVAEELKQKLYLYRYLTDNQYSL